MGFRVKTIRWFLIFTGEFFLPPVKNLFPSSASSFLLLVGYSYSKSKFPIILIHIQCMLYFKKQLVNCYSEDI